MKVNKTITLVLVVILLFSISGCSEKKYDDESLNMASLFSVYYGGISIMQNGNYKDLAEDIFLLRTEFKDEKVGSLDSDEGMQNWYISLHDDLEKIKLNGKSKYFIYDRCFLGTFKQTYDISDTADDLWDDHDYDGSPNWNDPDYQVFLEEGCR